MSDILNGLRNLAERFEQNKEMLASNEQFTKTVLIQPFIRVLGFDPENPMEVFPEYIGAVHGRNDDKVDYALMHESKPFMLIECKPVSEKDLLKHKPQLIKYFMALKTRHPELTKWFGLLTNGVEFWFFTSLDAENVMDEEPFLKIDLRNISEKDSRELSKFHKANFKVEDAYSAANDIRTYTLIRVELEKQLKDPSDEFVKLLSSGLSKSRMSSKTLVWLKPIVERAIKDNKEDYTSDLFMRATELQQKGVIEDEEVKLNGNETVEENVFTDEEREAFLIVKSIIREVISVDRIKYKDNKSYVAVLVDDSSRKQICKLQFGAKTKYIILLDSDKKEIKQPILVLDDIFQYRDLLIQATSHFI